MTPEGLVELKKVPRLAAALRTVKRILLCMQQMKKRRMQARRESRETKSMARFSVIRSDEPKKKILSFQIGPPAGKAIVKSAEVRGFCHRRIQRV